VWNSLSGLETICSHNEFKKLRTSSVSVIIQCGLDAFVKTQQKNQRHIGRKFMKLLGLSFSPRKEGNTELLLARALAGAARLGAQTELYRISDKDIKPCDGCSSCFKTGECPIKDDMPELCDRMLEADGIIFGTPVYFYNMTAQGKAAIDRTIALGRPDRSLANKVGGIIVVGGSLGLIDAVKDLYFYMVTRQMLPANFVAAYAAHAGDVKKLPKCMNAAEDLGKQIVKIAEKKFSYPEEFGATHIAYGTHTW
jgi:multimeric flavodoxin WrbA